MNRQSLYTARASRAIVATAGIIAAALWVAVVNGSDDHRRDGGRDSDSYTIALFGDMPYNALGKQQYPALLADINAKHVAFSVFDGDLKAGGDGPCTDSLYTPAHRVLRHARAAARLGARRQRLDRLLGPLRPGHAAVLRSARAARARAHAVRVHRSQPGPDRRSRSRASRARAGVRRVLGERALEVRPGRLHRPQRPGLERQLSVRRRRRRDAVASRDRRQRAEESGAQGRRSSTGCTKASPTPSRCTRRA